MIDITKISGRLGNQMFQLAFCYDYAKKNKLTDRYYQDPKFFEDSKDDILSFFRADISLKPIDKVAIHVRRGDYVGHDFYVDLMKIDYYKKAMSFFPEKEFIVISDDITWCENQKLFNGCEFVHGTEIEDMNVMAACTGHIIANSSFSWWGAYISPYSKFVVAPSREHWYTDGLERTKCPDAWIRL